MKERIHLIARFRPASGRSRWALLLIIALGMGGLTDALTEEPKLQVEQQPGPGILGFRQLFAEQERPDGPRASENWRKLAAAPDDLNGRGGNTAIWTGSELIVFGGEGMGVSYDNGARYSLAENTWVMLPRKAAPSSRTQHSAVWTGQEMIVWGGFGGIWGVNTNRSDGARFNPRTDTWQPVTTRDAPTARFQHTAVWTGKEMLVWGGYTDAQSIYRGAYNDACLNSGGCYDPAADTWRDISTRGAPSKRFNHAALWTGEHMLIWGGNDETKALNDGGLYDPATDTWRPISTWGAPSPRKQALAVWTGREMIVWGGASRDDSKVFEDGARYDPATDRWTPMSNTGAPKGRVFANALWTGAEMVFWGGVNDAQANGVSDPGRYVATGGCYNPTTDSWVGIRSSASPSARATTAVWTGKGILIFGGYNGSHLNDAYILVGSSEPSPALAEPSHAVGIRTASNEPRPLAQWSFSEKDGDFVPDATGHGYDARIHGQPRLAPHRGENQALEFDGSGDNAIWRGNPQNKAGITGTSDVLVVDVAGNTSRNGGQQNCGLSIGKRLTQGFTELSVEAWMRKTPAGWMPIIYRDLWDSHSGFGLYAEWKAGKVIFGHYDAAGHNWAQSETTVQDGHWHHVVGTMQPAAGQGYLYRIYVDGQLDAEQTDTWGVEEAPPDGGILKIAYPNSSGADHPYQGALDGIAIYDVALTPAQVKARFDAGRE